MAVPAPYYLPIRAPRGRLVHAASDLAAGWTACGLAFSGWKIATGRRRGMSFAAVLGCAACRRAVGLSPNRRRP